MRKLFVYPMMAATLALGVSCGDDDDDNNNSGGSSAQDPVQVTNTLTSGEWKITQFRDDDDDRTALFTGYSFSFGPGNTVTAVDGDDAYEGVWALVNDDDDDDDHDDNDLELHISFAPGTVLQQLNDDDWEVRQRTNTKIRLSDDDDDDLDDDLLIFEKL